MHSVAISFLSTDSNMAESPTQLIGSYEPEPRFSAPTVSIGSNLFMFRGFLQSFQKKEPVKLPHQVEVFNSKSLSWKAVQSFGELPPWYRAAAVTTFQDKVYYYGGCCVDPPSFCNEMYTFSSKNFLWIKMFSTGQVLRTINSGLVSLPNGHLLTAGGYAECPTNWPGTGFIPCPGNIGQGWTNQLLYYNTKSGMCMDCQYYHCKVYVMHKVTTGPLCVRADL